MRKSLIRLAIASAGLAVATLFAVPMTRVHADDDDRGGKSDFGEKMEHLLNTHSMRYFAIRHPLDESAPGTVECVPGQ